MSSAKPFYITTAIDYANGKPHLGHAYEKVLTDTIARFRRMSGEPVHFLTGLDEHGQKVQQTAEKLGLTPQENCDRVAVDFRQLLVDLDISNDDFIRTTEPRHKAVVQKYLQQLFDAGLIYRADYTGFYSVRQEQFVLEKEKLENGAWPEIYGEVTQVTESAYFFRLKNYKDWLIGHLEANPEWIYPAFRRNQVLEFLKEDINDLCISRPKARLSWGIELPFDREFVTYVWFDALVNYVSAVEGKGLWPADAHVIGKDILVPPHAVYWPCMLKALGLELPKKLVVHGWWGMGGAKISKSTGGGGSILDNAQLYGTDAFRYYLIREMVVGNDADFNPDQLAIRYRADLGNTLGNLLNRLLSIAGKNTAGLVPAAALAGDEKDAALRALWAATAPAYLDTAMGYRFHEALDTLWVFVRAMNAYIDERAPWKLAKSTEPADREKLEATLAHLAEGLRLVAVAIAPIMPTIAKRLHECLGLEAPATFAGNFEWSGVTAGKTLAASAILFPPVVTPEEAAAAEAAKAAATAPKPAKQPKGEKK